MSGKISIIELAAVCLFLATGCLKNTAPTASLTLRLVCGESVTKGMTDPDEYALTDANIYVFNSDGLLEKHSWVQLSSGEKFSVDVVSGEKYLVYVFGNAGFRMKDMSLEQLLDFKYWLSRPDDYPFGIPMAGIRTDMIAGEQDVVDIGMERLMCKLSLSIDRSKLRQDVDFHVHTVKIGNCPRYIRPFSPRAMESHDETFPAGFCKIDGECSGLNHTVRSGVSEEVALFLLENPASELDTFTSPYVEIQADYVSDQWYSEGDVGLVYRFYIRENDSYRLERNCHYRVSVTPNGDGLLNEDSWRVDKSNLVSTGQEYSMKISPAGSWVEGTYYPYYYEMKTQSTMHFDIVTVPSGMKVRLREDLVEDELADGRAEYVMDKDGRGFTVRSLDRDCMSTMENIPGYPLGEEWAETIVIGISGAG